MSKPNSNNPISVFSEIGKLKSVLIHRPGDEVENLTPDLLEELLFDDIPFKQVAIKEHDAFAETFKSNGVEVFYIEELVAKTLEENKGMRDEFIDKFISEANIKPQFKDKYRSFLAGKPDLEMVKTMIAGTKKIELSIKDEDPFPFVTNPLPNILFQRDPFATVGHGATVHKMWAVTRNRETLFADFVLKNNSMFKGKVKFYYERTDKAHVEGGDIMVLNKKTLVIGMSQRTEMQAIELLAKRLFEDPDTTFTHVAVIDLPKARAFMHLDTVFTNIDYATFIVHPLIFNYLDKFNLWEITKAGKKKIDKNLQVYLSELVGKNVTLIKCGGDDAIAAGREQWNDGTNVIVLEPGKVIAYERNHVTIDLLKKAGVTVLTIPSSELSRGRGGPRCMSMPIIREEVNNYKEDTPSQADNAAAKKDGGGSGGFASASVEGSDANVKKENNQGFKKEPNAGATGGYQADIKREGNGNYKDESKSPWEGSTGANSSSSANKGGFTGSSQGGANANSSNKAGSGSNQDSANANKAGSSQGGGGLKGKNFLTLLDFSPEEINTLLELAMQLKKDKKAHSEKQHLKNKNIALIFEKTSTRTRCAFEVGAYDQGAHVTYIGSTGSQIGVKETMKDTARVLGRMYDGIEFRGSAHAEVEILGKYAGVPVWNGLTDDYHPTQILADFLTLKEHVKNDLKGIKLVFYGDTRNNMGNSLMIGSAKMGLHFVGCAPKALWPKEELVKKCQEIAKSTGAVIEFSEDAKAAAKDADAIYTDVWVSMGEPEDVWAKRIELLSPYQVNKEIMQAAKPTAIFLHCLPAFHNKDTKVGKEMGEKFKRDAFEVTDDVFESKQSKVFDEAENRLHTIKAVMVATLGD